jgi:hypothetical protein
VADLLILQRKDRDKLGERHDQFMKGEVTSFVCVVVRADGTTEVDFDVVDAQDQALYNKLGGGLISAVNHLREIALQERIKSDALKGNAILNHNKLN